MGCGDSLLLWSEYSPSQIVGVTNVATQLAVAQKHVEAQGLEFNEKTVNIELTCDDAIKWTNNEVRKGNDEMRKFDYM
jgi:cyclopropane fatty-acyl-phospholipid synthase-like methyltransferase